MNFEHLVEINDGNFMVQQLSRSQLWQGLVLRAEKPESMVIGLDECRILARDGESLRRELRFGDFHVRDRVRFDPMNYVVYEVEATDRTPASTLTMAVEEPRPGHLFVRFTYSNNGAEAQSGVDRFYQDHLKQAYVQADIDTISTIRRMAAEGELNERMS